jgi:hypothetical protein
LTDENVFESTKSVREILGLTAEFLALEPKARDVLLVASNDSPLREQHELLKGTARWRFAPRPLKSLEQVLRRLS